MQIAVALNGTKSNPYHQYGVRFNPFPQTGNRALANAEMRLNELGGDPIDPDTYKEYIREKLYDFSEEFIELCIRNYKPGEYVRFLVNMPD